MGSKLTDHRAERMRSTMHVSMMPMHGALGFAALRFAFTLMAVAILGCLGVELGAWVSEKLGYVEMHKTRGRDIRPMLSRFHKLARGGLGVFVLAAVVLAVLVTANDQWS